MYTVYQILEGETLNDIANKVGISVEELASINGITPNSQIKGGNYVVIPNKSSDNQYFKRYIIKKGDTIYAIARNYGLNPSDLLRLNGLNNDDAIYPGDNIFIPKEGVTFYITKMDDTLNEVSRKMNITPNDLARVNPTIYLTNDQLLVYKK